MVTILQHTSDKYQARTDINAKESDATIAFAIDFTSAGERLTKSLVLKHNRKYISINPFYELNIQEIINTLNSIDGGLFNEICLNVAGNGIYTFKRKISQIKLDQLIYDILAKIVNDPTLKNNITHIRSGGQTGADEAGAKAGIKLGIPTTILFPKGYLIRDKNGIDLTPSYEETVKRFTI